MLLAYMPFHVFLVQSLSLLTGGLDIWKVGKDVFLGLAVLFTICLVWAKGKGTRTFNALVIITAAYGALHLLIWALNPHIYAPGAMLGTLYNVRLLLFALLGCGGILLLPKFAFGSLLKMVLVVSTVVSILGVLQYFLPNDFLTHVGYSIARGARPSFAIDDNAAFPRIMSTLREPNALGAYLVVPATALTILWFRARSTSRRYLVTGLLALHLLAIFWTFSRSAWFAVAVSMALAVWWQNSTWFLRQLKRWWPVLAGLILVAGAVTYTQYNTQFFKQYIAHSDTKVHVNNLDSNSYHALLVKQGLEGIQHKPLGHGPGTAGLVSIQNPGGGQLTENYYVQIGYEVGVAGALLFIGINVWLYALVWRRRDWYGWLLCASFWGYVVTNMLLHSWSNEAVAAQWWILAGMAVALPPAKHAAVQRP